MPGSWLASLEEQARHVLPEIIFEYYRQGSRDSISADEAVAAWQRIRLLPRVLNDVREVALGTTVLGKPAPLPFGVAPTTLQRAADAGGEVSMARGCAAAGVPLVLSSNATASFGDVAATGADWWLQAYLPQRRDAALPMLEAAVAAGARAIVLTVDTPVVATKYYSGGAGALTAVPPEWLRTNLGAAADEPKATDLGPADIAWLATATGLPVVVKGVLHRDDARRAADAGAAAVWVSNHGGRQLDRCAATADCLGAVVSELGGQVDVYVDGGIRDGISALHALALGADAIFFGRLPLFSLAIAGSEGVERLFADLTEQVVEAFRLAGCADLRAVRALSNSQY